MPFPSTGPKMFCAGPIFFGLVQKLNYICFPLQKLNLLYGNHLLVWHKNCPTGPNLPKFQILFHKKSQPQDFLKMILCLSHPAMPIEFFMHYRGVRLWITIVRPQFPHYYTDTKWDTLHCTTTCVSGPRVKFSYSRENNKWQHISKF